MAPDDRDYAAAVARDVAARYGVPVDAGAVQIVPRGKSGYPPPVWVGGKAGDPGRLLWPPGHPLSKEGRRAASLKASRRRGAAGSPEIRSRRDLVRAAHAEGLHDMAIAEALQMRIKDVMNDRNVMGLRCNPAPKAASAASQQRAARAREIIRLHGEGLTDRAMAEALKVALKTVAIQRREIGLRANVASRARKPAADAGARRQAIDDPARVEAIRQMEAEGIPVKEMAERLGIGRGHASRLRRGLGLPSRSTVAAASAETGEQRRAIIRTLLEKGETDLQVIAAAAGCGYDTLRRDLKRLGRWPVAPAPLTPAQRYDRLRAMLAEGLPRHEMAEKLGIPLALLARDLRALGVEVPRVLPKCRRGKPVPPPMLVAERRRRVGALRAAGRNIEQIAAELCSSRSLVSQDISALRDAGVDVTPPARGTSARVIRRRELVAQMRAEGKTIEQMVKATGASRSAISGDIEVLSARGAVQSRPRGRPTRRATDPQWAAEIRALAAQGMGVPTIAARLRFSPGAITRVLQAADAQPERRAA